MFQEIFKKYRKGRLRFSDIQSWVDDKGQSPLYNLKEQSHFLFRHKGKESFRKKEWLLDLVIGSIFHEAMKLRENIYQLEIYRPKYLQYRLHIGKSAYERDYSQQFERIILKAGQSVLLGIKEIRSLFHDAAEQLIDLFKEKKRNPYSVRFLLEHQSLLQKVYGSKKGKELFNLIFEGGLQEAYDRAGRSYLLSGHYDLASSYFTKALKLGPPQRELLFLLYFSLGMNAYYKNLHPQTLSFWRKLISSRLKKYLKKHYVRQIEEVCHMMASEWNEEGKPKSAQKALSLADQVKKMLG
jgi:tetratricopeptide (TPR) repeat protein